MEFSTNETMEVIHREKGVVIYKKMDGTYKIQIISKKLAAKLKKARKLVSQELGRPVSNAETLDHMLKNVIEHLQQEMK